MALTEEQKKEFKKCKKDPIYFIRNYCYIETEDSGIIKFDLFPYQEKIIKELLGDVDNLFHCRKSRQIGVSTLLSAYALWLTNFHMAKSVAIVATDLRTAKKLHHKATFAWKHLPDWMRMGYRNKNTTQLFLKNSSKIEAFPFSPDKGTRSISASLVIMDECAFIPKAEKLWQAVEPSLSNTGNVVAVSSPDAPTGWFYDVYKDAVIDEQETDWNIMKLSWEVHPERDQAWRDRKDRRLGKRKASREYDAEFGVAEDSYFDPDYLERIKEEMVCEPKKKVNPFKENQDVEGALWIWEEPQPNEEYLVVVDPAEGANDLSAIEVIKMSSLEQVAEYAKRIHYSKFNYLPVKIAENYNNALLVIEDNSIGKTTISRSKDLNYFNIYQRGKTRKEQDILGVKNEKYGWNTNTKTRPMIIKSLESFIETDEGFCTIHSERLYEQFTTFVEKRGKPQAQDKGYDDNIMALGIGLFIYEMIGTKIQNPDEEHDILQMYSAIQKQAKEKYENIKEFDDMMDNLSDEEKEKEKLKKKRKQILKDKGDKLNLNDPFLDIYMDQYRNEFGF